MTPDKLNGMFELVGALVLLLNVRRLWKDKQVQGVSMWAAAFFAAWGWWNLYYYPYLGQWWSCGASGLVAIVNTAWVSLALTLKWRR